MSRNMSGESAIPAVTPRAISEVGSLWCTEQKGSVGPTTTDPQLAVF